MTEIRINTIRNDNFIKLCKEDPEKVFMYIKEGLISQELFNSTYFGITCVQCICRHHPEYLEELLNCDLMNKELFNKYSSSSVTCLHNICEKHPEYLEILLNSPFMTQELFNKQDTHGYTCLHDICERHPEYLETLLNSPFMNQELFNERTNYGYTCLHIICKKYPEYLETLLNSPFMTQKLLYKRDNNKFSCKDTIINNEELLNLPLFLIKLDDDILNIILYGKTSKTFRINKLIRKRNKITRSIKVIDNFMYKSYYKTGGYFYQKQLEKISK